MVLDAVEHVKGLGGVASGGGVGRVVSCGHGCDTAVTRGVGCGAARKVSKFADINLPPRRGGEGEQ